MRSHSNIEIRRCRPLLGTFAEVAAFGRKAADLERGIDAAFAAVEKVCRLMSYHNPQSDVSRMNREAFPKSVVVDPWTWRVVQAAQQFAEESDGTFNITITPSLISWRYLPRLGYRFDRAATWRHIFLRENHRVFFCPQLIVDLGGIAKGFAVDRAVDALKENGVENGIVNAGGDLRVFGTDIANCPFAPSFGSRANRRCSQVARTSDGYFRYLLFRARLWPPSRQSNH
jgi:FAD:protein FMN transferase